MNKDIIIRFVLTTTLIVFVWLEHMWAIKLTITLLAIGAELNGLLLQKIVKWIK